MLTCRHHRIDLTNAVVSRDLLNSTDTHRATIKLRVEEDSHRDAPILSKSRLSDVWEGVHFQARIHAALERTRPCVFIFVKLTVIDLWCACWLPTGGLTHQGHERETEPAGLCDCIRRGKDADPAQDVHRIHQRLH